jgi:hypothetical protein
MSSGNSVAADTTVSGSTTGTGRGTSAGRGQVGGRGRRGNRGGRVSGRGSNHRPRGIGFKGTTTEMNDGNVFECYDEQTDRRHQFAKTVKALEGYVKKNLKYAEDLAPLFATESKLPVLVEKPEKPGDNADKVDLEIWKEDIRDLSKRKGVLHGNLAAIHAVIWGQCSEAMKAKIKSLDGYDASTEADDCKWLLSNIKAVSMQ